MQEGAEELVSKDNNHYQSQPGCGENEEKRLTWDGTAEPVSRDQTLRRERGQENSNFPCSADREEDTVHRNTNLHQLPAIQPRHSTLSSRWKTEGARAVG